MKVFLRLSTIILLIISLPSFAITLRTQEDRLSYTLGNNLGKSFRENDMQLNPALLMQGAQDGLAGRKSKLTQTEKQQVLTQYQHDMLSKIRQQVADQAKTNASAGNDFLTANAKKSGVKTTSSGLQYKVLSMGKGPKPKKTDIVEVDYEGSLINGKVFDSSYKRGKPVKFPLNQVIPGWTEGLQMMPVGSTWMLYIPANLAYGQRGMPMAGIGPNATLIFKVHLISIVHNK